MTFLVHSERETIRLGEQLGLCLQDGDFVALTGELGSGKTWFAKGLALGLGVSSGAVVTSPSFALLNEYQGRVPFFHMDAYRLERLSDFLSAGLEEYFHEEGVVAMEWAERWPEILPERKVSVRISILDEVSREIALCGSHPRAAEIMSELEERMY